MAQQQEDNKTNSGIIDRKLNFNKMQFNEVMNGVAEGGKDWGCQEKLTNLHEEVTKGGNIQTKILTLEPRLTTKNNNKIGHKRGQ